MQHYLIAINIDNDDDEYVGSWMLEFDADSTVEALDKAKQKVTEDENGSGFPFPA